MCVFYNQYKLLNFVCCSLVNKSSSLGQSDWDSDGTLWNGIKLLGTDITLSDPEFLLKVCYGVCVCVCGVCDDSIGDAYFRRVPSSIAYMGYNQHIFMEILLLLHQVAVYTRQELNIRITANFLLALAAHLPNSKPHLRRYFCSAIQLPSDWLEVTRIYSTVCWEFSFEHVLYYLMMFVFSGCR